MRLRSPRTRLSDILITAGLLQPEDLARALDRQKMQPGRLGSQLLTLGLVSEDDLAKALSIQYEVAPFLPSINEVTSEAIARLPQPTARRCHALPFAWEPERGTLHVVMSDPRDLRAVDEVRFASGARKVAVHVTPETTLERLISRHYDGVEIAATAPPEIAVNFSEPAATRRNGSETPSAKTRSDVLVADPDPKRRRAMAGLLEASGFRTTRAGTLEEAADLAGSRSWAAVWLHRDWDISGVESAEICSYDDPVSSLREAGGPVEAVRREALEVAEVAAQRLLGERLPAARKAVSLVRFLAARSGIEGLGADLLALRTWRGALTGWSDPSPELSATGSQIVTAVAAYERAVAGGRTPAEAAEELRRDSSLDSGAVASLIRWAVGEDMLSRFETPPKAFLMLPDEAAGRLSDHLNGSGWQVTRTPPSPAAAEDLGDAWDAVLADLGSGLPFLEKMSTLPQERRPPIFLLAANPNSADTMYALKLGAEDVVSFDTHPEVLETKLRRAASRRSPRKGLVTGNLRDMGLADILQILSNGRKTAVVRVEGSGAAGEVAVDTGAIVDARLGDVSGEEALYQMIAWGEGSFRIFPDEHAQRVTLEGSTEGLLMEGFRRMDEARRAEASDEIPQL